MSITKVDKNKYRIFVSDGTNLDGSRRRYTKTITTELKGRDLEKHLMLAKFDFEDEVKKKSPKFYKLSKGTFKEFTVWWLEYKKLSNKTLENYNSFLDLRILPLIGHKTLDKINTGDMVELMKLIEETPSERTKKPLSNKSVKHYHTLLKGIFNDAVSLDIIKDNPMRNVKVKSTYKKVRDNYYTKEDIDKLLKILPKAPVRYQLALLITISTGIRLGELTALQWKHIDTNDNIITIEQANSYAGGKTVIKDTKTISSIRKISYPSFLNELIEDHREEEKVKREYVGPDWYYKNSSHENDFLFTQSNGKVIFKDTISDWFRKFRRKNDLKEITWHGLRHTSTTILIASGINIKNISARLGHTRASTTTDIYSHALETIDKESANIFDNLLGNKENGTNSGTNKTNLKIIK